MRKAAMTAVGLMVITGLLTGCEGERTEEIVSKQVEKVAEDEKIEEKSSKEEHKLSEETEDNPKDSSEISEESPENVIEEEYKEELALIDTSIPLETGVHIAVVSKGTTGEFWSEVKNGMQSAVDAVNEAYGFAKSDRITMNFEGSENEMDTATQVNTLDAVIAENPDVICISVGDMSSCQAQLEAAYENGIPVVVFDSNVSESELVAAYRATDNAAVGRIAAQHLAEAMEENGAVAIFSAPEKSESVCQRRDGFLNVLENYPDMEVVEIIYQDQEADMKSAMQSVIVEHPELKGIYCTSAVVADMYLELGEILESRNMALVGVDATTSQQEAIRNGQEVGVVSQNPHMMGFETIWTALLLTVSEETEVEVNKFLEPAWIDLETIDEEENGKYLY